MTRWGNGREHVDDKGTTLVTFNINILTKEGIQHQSVQTRDGGVWLITKTVRAVSMGSTI